MRATKEHKQQQSRVIQNMTLTRRGRFSSKPIIKYFVGHHLLNRGNILNYINRPICHDAVAYTRYLLGANISRNDLVNVNGGGWLQHFDYTSGQRWQGNIIPAGSAVGFRDLRTNIFFHSSISLGGTMVRGINGNVLGDAWRNVGDCNLVTCLIPINNTYRIPALNREPCEVWISNL